MNQAIKRRRLFLIGLLVCLFLGVATRFTFPVANADNGQFTASGTNGAVVSTSRDASEVGLEILKEGGNAIDAAVAVGYALAVTDPCCGNLGGGGFMTVRFADGEETFINFRETAPLKSTADMYLDEEKNIVDGLSTRGYLAVGVPGSVKGLNYALDKYGTMNRDRVIAPAVELAKNGYTLQQGDIDIFQAGKSRLQEAETAKIFLDENQKIRKVGDVLKQPELAATLEQLIPEGDAFYNGEIAEKVVAASEANGGILSLEDFANYQVSEYQPVSCDYRGYRVISSAPPGGGTTLCQMLNILAGYDLKELGWRTTESMHRILSAMLFAFSDRNSFLGDPDFVENPVVKLLSQEYTESIRQQIPDYQAIPPEEVYDREVQTEGTNTTHYSVIDKEGNAVAVTYTINSYFGAGVVAPGTGFILNNEMDDFTSKVGAANQFGLKQGSTNIIEPGKRPLSSMSPTIVTKDNEVLLIAGTPGGSTIPTTVLQVITSVIDYGKSLEEAVNTPRFHYQGFPKKVMAEYDAIPAKTIFGLRLRGYQVTPSLRRWGGAESILIDPETQAIEAVNDIRKPAGAALAY